MNLRFWDSRGAALVEMAVTAPIFLLLILGGYELGRIAYYAIEVENAARAGATFGAVNIANSTQANVSQAAKNDAPNLSLTVTPGTACVCETISSTGTTYSPSSGTTSCTAAVITSCGGTVSTTSTSNVIGYVTVSTQANVNSTIHIPGVTNNTYTLHGYSELRILQN